MTDRQDSPQRDRAPRERPRQVGPPAAPGERRLDRPPSDRYVSAPVSSSPTLDPPATEPTAGAVGRHSPARGVAFGAIATFIGAASLVILGGAMAISAGLLVVAAAIGYAVGLGTVLGAGETLSRPTRTWTAAALAGMAVLLGQVGLWLFARAQGGVLAPIDYLGTTFGPLVPLELLLAVAVAWWRAR